MKLCLLSDLHLEFGPYEWPDPNTYDVLILAGDICSWKSPAAEDLKKYLEASEKKVIYVPGNHEYYGGDIEDFFEINNPNVSMPGSTFGSLTLTTAVPSPTFLYGTMWTDFNSSNNMDMLVAARRMNDYHCIKNNKVILKPQDTVNINREFKTFFDGFLNELSSYDDKKIIITHHSPLEHQDCEGENFYGRTNDAAYVCSWAKEIIKNNKIDVWCHGHTHVPRDFTYEGTRILSNPRGYVGKKGSEPKGFKKEGLIFEV